MLCDKSHSNVFVAVVVITSYVYKSWNETWKDRHGHLVGNFELEDVI